MKVSTGLIVIATVSLMVLYPCVSGLTCPPGWKLCDDGIFCISASRRCDGISDPGADYDDGSGEDHCTDCLKCSGARQRSDCTTVTCNQPNEKFCHWEDVYTPKGWIYNSGCSATCPSEHASTTTRGGSPSDGNGLYNGCCDANMCNDF